MVCIFCGGTTRTTNSRPQKRSNRTWRRRQCLTCTQTVTTEESVLLGSVITVESLNGLQQPFEREKLLVSLYNSLRHRPTALQDATELTETVTKQLLAQQAGQILHAPLIIQTAAETLDRFDTAAAVQYRAFHPTSFSSKKGNRA